MAIEPAGEATYLSGADENGAAYASGDDDGEAAPASEAGEVETARASGGAGGRRNRVALIMGLSALAHLAILAVTAIVRPSEGLTEGEIVRRDYIVKLEALTRTDAQARHDGAPPERGAGAQTERGVGAQTERGSGAADAAREGRRGELPGGGAVWGRDVVGPHDGSAGFVEGAAAGVNAEGARAGDGGAVVIEAGGDARSCPGGGLCLGVEGAKGKGGVKHVGGPKIVALPGAMHGGALEPAAVRRVVRRDFGKFRMCYENRLKADPRLAGRVTVRFVIGGDGTVLRVANGGSDLPDPQVVACVVRTFGGMSFPRPEGGDVTVVFPVLFSAR